MSFRKYKNEIVDIDYIGKENFKHFDMIWFISSIYFQSRVYEYVFEMRELYKQKTWQETEKNLKKKFFKHKINVNGKWKLIQWFTERKA